MAEHFEDDGLGLQIFQKGFGDCDRNLFNRKVLSISKIFDETDAGFYRICFQTYILYVIKSGWIALASVLYRFRREGFIVSM